MALGLLLGTTVQAKAQPSYSFTTFDLPGSLGPNYAFGINSSGQIVGYYGLLDNGIYTTLNVPGASYSQAHGINASGQIVGSYTDAGGTHGFLATPVP
jgi:uncharacterized membrane protein